MAQRAVLLVNTNPVSEERTDDYHEWYSQVHIPQILERIPGVVAARRYTVDQASPGQPDQRFLALYEIEADEPGQVVGALFAAMGNGQLDASDSMDPNASVLLYREI